MSEVWPQLRAALDVLFDPDEYAARYAGRLAPGQTPLEHFLSTGLRQGLSPHRLFDPAWYAARHGLSATENAFAHFIARGERAGLAPGPYFDVVWYRRTNADVAAADVNSLVHYVEFGRREGRLPSPLFDPATPTGDSGAWLLDEADTGDPRWLLSHALRPTTLSRLLRAQEASSFIDPEAVRQIVVRTRPARGAGRIADAVVIGGARGVLQDDGPGMLLAPGAETGWALANVTHAVAPPIGSAIHLLGLGEPCDTAQLDRWAGAVRDAAGAVASPHLLVDEALPAPVRDRLRTAAGPASTVFRVPARRLMHVRDLTMLDVTSAMQQMA